MIKWCCYCQKFLGEAEPLDNYAISHGMCLACKAKGLEKLDDEMPSIKRLADLQRRLMGAGAKQDKALARKIIAEAQKEGVQSVDLLMGIIAPILWEVGDLWSKGTITVADEHNFTAFFNGIVREMEEQGLFPQPNEKFGDVDILLTNAPRNFHHLGLHSLNLWLHSQNIHSVLIHPPYSSKTLFDEIRKRQPRFVGFSVALSEQIPATLALCDEIQKEFRSKAPTLLMGGSAIKRGATHDKDSVTSLHDINELLGLLK